jgi:hypothetical protein
MTKQQAGASDIEQAKRNAARARARMQTTVGALKQRLNPRTIAADAKERVRETTGAIGERASGVVKQRPAATSAAAGVATLIVFRKPVGRLVKRLFGHEARQKRASRKATKHAEQTAIAANSAGLPPDELIPGTPDPTISQPAKQE